jgi:hypothetical protein
MDQAYRDQIANEFRNCVGNTITRLKSEATYKPFHTALLCKEAIFWGRFERSFSTSFGQRVIEEIARIVALSNGATLAQRQKVSLVKLDTAHDAAVNAHITSLREGNHRSHDWITTMREIQSVPLTGETKEIRVISDLWWQMDGVDNYISLKTPKPNIDQTAVAKEDCLRLKLAYPSCNAYFGLPYNPYGSEKSSYAFDFHHDSVVLIGKEMWDTIGGPGCYEEIIELAKEVGKKTKPSIAELMRTVDDI